MGFLDTRKDDLFDLITLNGAFKNPFDEKLLEINNFIPTTIQTLENSTILPALEVQEIINSIRNLETTLGRFKTHTDNLSGIGLSNGLNGANLATISQVVATVNKYKNDSATCDLIYKAFGALINFSQIVQLIDNVMAIFRNSSNIPARIIQIINTTISAIEAQIQQDIIAFADAQLNALRLAVANALTSLFDDPCIGEIISIIGTEQAKQILRREIPNVRNVIPRVQI